MDSILLIEDDNEICEIIQFYLTKNKQYKITAVKSAEAALQLVKKANFDAILLDIMLPGLDGISFCEYVRKSIYCPIIFISCADDEETIIRAMHMGGDDYLVKPFNCAVLQAYVEANIRRSRMIHKKSENLKVSGLVLNTISHRVWKNNKEIILSPTEYEILYYMMKREGEFILFEELYKAIWDMDSHGDLRTLFTHIGNLRRKIEDNAKTPIYIVTYRRDGYIFYPHHMNLG